MIPQIISENRRGVEQLIGGYCDEHTIASNLVVSDTDSGPTMSSVGTIRSEHVRTFVCKRFDGTVTPAGRYQYLHVRVLTCRARNRFSRSADQTWSATRTEQRGRTDTCPASFPV